MTPMSAEARLQLVLPYRQKRDTKRADLDVPAGLPLPENAVAHSLAYTDPAPPWVPAIVDALWKRGCRPPVIAWALQWCAAGEPVHRAEQLLTIVKLWPGQGQLINDVLSRFLRASEIANSGRAATATKPRHVEAVWVPREYGDKRR